MRSLIPTPRPRDDSRRDEGAVLVWVGLMLTVLLGMGALVVDAGALSQPLDTAVGGTVVPDQQLVVLVRLRRDRVEAAGQPLAAVPGDE